MASIIWIVCRREAPCCGRSETIVNLPLPVIAEQFESDTPPPLPPPPPPPPPLAVLPPPPPLLLLEEPQPAAATTLRASNTTAQALRPCDLASTLLPLWSVDSVATGSPLRV